MASIVSLQNPLPPTPTPTLPLALAPAPSTPPLCRTCRRPSTRTVTRASNRHGNAGRPYYKCVPCGRFVVFADARGNDPQNPPCRCGLSSKTQRARAGGLHYVCRVGACGFYARCVDGATGEQVVARGDELVAMLARLNVI